MEQNGKLYLTSDETVLFDNNYRYIISILEISHVIKKGTPITILENIHSFCNQLLFDKNILLKIIGKQLSCKCAVDKNTQKYYLQGQYTLPQIKYVVYEFIQKYLLCINCDKPEVNLKYKNTNIKQKCRACGSNVYLENCNENIVNILQKL